MSLFRLSFYAYGHTPFVLLTIVQFFISMAISLSSDIVSGILFFIISVNIIIFFQTFLFALCTSPSSRKIAERILKDCSLLTDSYGEMILRNGSTGKRIRLSRVIQSHCKSTERKMLSSVCKYCETNKKKDELEEIVNEFSES